MSEASHQSELEPWVPQDIHVGHNYADSIFFPRLFFLSWGGMDVLDVTILFGVIGVTLAFPQIALFIIGAFVPVATGWGVHLVLAGLCFTGGSGLGFFLKRQVHRKNVNNKPSERWVIDAILHHRQPRTERNGVAYVPDARGEQSVLAVAMTEKKVKYVPTQQRQGKRPVVSPEASA